ncbi:MAG: flagellar biosynthetic protein FliR [Clostridiales Family XIII bacterium]|jgi:flagellar biosynthetic protein FliR|nr:flagellar biosynthetic protein FliR [Clostridiales Family XIII bacterium]
MPSWNDLLLLLFAACRMFGVIFMNPVLGRQIMPTIVKIGLSLGVAMFAMRDLAGTNVTDYTGIDMLFSMLKEFAVGFTLGFVMTMFFSVFHIGGQIIDFQMGLAMATMFDPTSNSQITITGNLITIFYTLLFFVTDSHLNLLAIAAHSYRVAPLGLEALDGARIGVYAAELFAYIFIYAVQLALPWIVTIMVVEVAVGIMMKVVPNINVFVVNIQMKVVCGLVVLVTIIPALVRFMTQINRLMMEQLEEALMHLV